MAPGKISGHPAETLSSNGRPTKIMKSKPKQVTKPAKGQWTTTGPKDVRKHATSNPATQWVPGVPGAITKFVEPKTLSGANPSSTGNQVPSSGHELSWVVSPSRTSAPTSQNTKGWTKKHPRTASTSAGRAQAGKPWRTKNYHDTAYPARERESTVPPFKSWKNAPQRARNHNKNHKYCFKKDGQPNVQYRRKFDRMEAEVERHLERVPTDANANLDSDPGSSGPGTVYERPHTSWSGQMRGETARFSTAKKWKGRSSVTDQGRRFPETESAITRTLRESNEEQAREIQALRADFLHLRREIVGMEKRIDEEVDTRVEEQIESRLRRELRGAVQAVRELKQAFAETSASGSNSK